MWQAIAQLVELATGTLYAPAVPFLLGGGVSQPPGTEMSPQLQRLLCAQFLPVASEVVDDDDSLEVVMHALNAIEKAVKVGGPVFLSLPITSGDITSTSVMAAAASSAAGPGSAVSVLTFIIRQCCSVIDHEIFCFDDDDDDDEDDEDDAGAVGHHSETAGSRDNDPEDADVSGAQATESREEMKDQVLDCACAVLVACSTALGPQFGLPLPALFDSSAIDPPSDGQDYTKSPPVDASSPFGTVAQHMLEALRNCMSPNDEAATLLGAMAGLISPMKTGVHACAPFIDAIIPFAMRGMDNARASTFGAHPVMQRNAAYLCGVLFANSGEAGVKHLQPALAALHPLITGKSNAVRPDDCPDDMDLLGDVVDNAVSAISRILINADLRPHVPLTQVIPVFLAALPLRSDFVENENAFTAVAALVNTYPAEMGPLMPTIFGLSSNVFISSKHTANASDPVVCAWVAALEAAVSPACTAKNNAGTDDIPTSTIDKYGHVSDATVAGLQAALAAWIVKCGPESASLVVSALQPFQLDCLRAHGVSL